MGTLHPLHTLTLPRTLVLDPPMTDAELFDFCIQNDFARVERTREGAIVMNAPAGGNTSSGNGEIVYQLVAWWKTHRRGRVFDATGGFLLEDRSMLNPDASYVTAERLAGVTKTDRKRFPHVCPNFIIELLSESDSRPAAKRKMQRWIENGAELAWLIDPYKQTIHVYKPGSPPRPHTGPTLAGEGPVEGFTLDATEVWECYEF